MSIIMEILYFAGYIFMTDSIIELGLSLCQITSGDIQRSCDSCATGIDRQIRSQRPVRRETPSWKRNYGIGAGIRRKFLSGFVSAASFTAIMRLFANTLILCYTSLKVTSKIQILSFPHPHGVRGDFQVKVLCRLEVREMRQNKLSCDRSIGSASFFQKKILRFILALIIALSGSIEVTQAADETKLTEPEIVTFMERHYTDAILSQDALIQGDLETLRRRLADIAEQELPDNAPESWKPYHERLQKVVRNADEISSLEKAASVMGDVAEACGACHAALGIGKIYFWPASPDEPEELEASMRTHQWATERLWEGVTGPFEAAWNRGAAVLADVRVFEDDDSMVDSTLRALETELRDLGRQAQESSGLHERAVIYGRLLVTCAECHKKAGVTIPPAKPIPPWQK